MNWIIEKMSKTIAVLWTLSSYQISHARDEVKDFSIQNSSTTDKVSVETLVKKILFVVTGKYPFDYRDKFYLWTL